MTTRTLMSNLQSCYNFFSHSSAGRLLKPIPGIGGILRPLPMNASFASSLKRQYSTLDLNSQLKMKEIPVEGFEKVVVIDHAPSKLKSIVSIHNSSLGPALGGLRILPYSSFEKALTDANRLSEGMSYKSSLAGIGLGGGKSVIIANSKDVTSEMLKAYAAALNLLEGKYICAEDSGSTVDHINFIGRYTPYATGLSHLKSSGNPSPFTAWGTFRGIQATIEALDGTTSVEGKTVAIQGLGSVGADLADILFWHGAKLIVSDIDREKTAAIARKYNAMVSSSEEIQNQKCDILSPCALGGTLNPETIPTLQCRAIAGCANNQLLTDNDARKLKERGILYAPDFAVNAGGIINISFEVDEKGYDPTASRNAVDRIYDTVKSIFINAEKNGSTTHAAAVDLAKNRINNKEGKRLHPPCFHHYNDTKS